MCLLFVIVEPFVWLVVLTVGEDEDSFGFNVGFVLSHEDESGRDEGDEGHNDEAGAKVEEEDKEDEVRVAVVKGDEYVGGFE